MPKIERKAHEVEAALEEDIEIQGKRFRLYFQNRYTILSLTVDLLTGFFYIIGSVAALTSIPDRIGMYFYLAGSIFLTIRPILRIIKNIFIYDDLKAEKRKTMLTCDVPLLRKRSYIMNYLIFGLEIIAIVLWLLFGQHSLLSAIIGIVVIILISQFLHRWLHAR